MRAISLAETGRRHGKVLAPWPWAMNAAGKGTWFETREAALESAAKRLARGERNFDLGCFQINHRWHGDAFASLEAMIEPRSNADYAAQFLAALYAETGDWLTAVGHYHSRTPALAKAYRRRVVRLMDGGMDDEHPTIAKGGRTTERLATRPTIAPPDHTGRAATLRMAGHNPAGRLLSAGAGRALIEAATGRLLVTQPSGPLIHRLPRAGRPLGDDGVLFARERSGHPSNGTGVGASNGRRP
ncbi:MAG: hypothetical protein AAF968_06510 [Pseudomonadota bacterium]